MKNSTQAAVGLAFALMVGSLTASCSYLSGQQNAYVETVNGHKIATSDYNQALDQAKKQYSSRFGIDFTSAQGKQMLAGLQKTVLQQLTDRELLMEDADKRGLKATPAEVDAKLADIKKQFPDDATFQNTLKQYGLSEAELKEQVGKGLVVEKLQKVSTQDLKVTDQQVADYYAKNKTQFTHPEEVNASHILVKFDEKATDKPKDEARALAKIKDIQAQLKGGQDFAKLASQYSDDPGSKAHGGSLGYFSKGRMVPEFEKAAFSLKDGQVSEPVKTQFGYHLIKRVAEHPAGTEPLSAAAAQIRDQLLNQQRQTAFQAYVAGLHKNAVIAVRPEYQPKESPQASGDLSGMGLKTQSAAATR